MLEMMLMKDRGLTVADWRDHRPLIVIAGCGMSGVALALALQQRGMRAVIYEKDARFDSRSQGYGLTIQQVPALIPLFCYSSFVTVCTGCGCVEPAMCRHFGRQHQQWQSLQLPSQRQNRRLLRSRAQPVTYTTRESWSASSTRGRV